MRPLRRLLVRSLLAPFLLLPLLSCGYPKPSAKAVAAALARASSFAEPKTAMIPRRIEAHTQDEIGGGALDDRQLAKIDPVVAILHANKIINVQDSYGPEGDTGGYLHILTISLADDQPAELFVETDEAESGPQWAWRQVKKTPGWRVALGRREVVNVSRILDPSSPAVDKLPPGYVQAEFEFRWIPNDIGKLFDRAVRDDLPDEVQRASAVIGVLNSSATYGGRARLTRDNHGEWTVTFFECPRCYG